MFDFRGRILLLWVGLCCLITFIFSVRCDDIPILEFLLVCCACVQLVGFIGMFV